MRKIDGFEIGIAIVGVVVAIAVGAYIFWFASWLNNGGCLVDYDRTITREVRPGKFVTERATTCIDEKVEKKWNGF
jgi:hypothetical protein